MTVAKRFFDLQHIDREIDESTTALNSIIVQIDDKTRILGAEAELNVIKDQIKEIERQRRDLDYEAEDLRKNIAELHEKLYGGKVKNPKELMNMEQEKEMFQASLSKKDDSLLDLMEAEEAANKKYKIQEGLLSSIEKEWQQQQKELVSEKDKLESQLNRLNGRRDDLVSGIEEKELQVYEFVRSRKGNAVVRVEQGRCQGCHIKLPMNEWQKTRTGALVQCSSCGRILYLG
jgi:predicted  nucleic acid-binding Zn-ribbon protein